MKSTLLGKFYHDTQKVIFLNFVRQYNTSPYSAEVPLSDVLTDMCPGIFVHAVGTGSPDLVLGKGVYIKHVGGGPEDFTNFSKKFS